MRATEATTPPRLGLPYLDVKLATAAAATALHGAGYVALATLDIGHRAFTDARLQEGAGPR